MTEEEILSEIERLDAENAALKKQIALLEEKKLKREIKNVRAKQTPAKRNYSQTETKVSNNDKNTKEWLIVVGCLAAAVVVLLIIWQSGLLIPLGLLGLVSCGILKVR